MLIEIVITGLLLIALTLLATIDMAFGQFSDVGLRRLITEAEGAPRARASWFLTEIPDTRFVLVALLVGLLVAAIFRQFIPRLIAVRNPERTLLLLLPLFRPVYRLLAFFALPWRHRIIARGAAAERAQRREQLPEAGAEECEEGGGDVIQALIDVGAEEGILEEQQGELIHSIIEFGDTRVNEVMTPRTEINALDVGANVRQARDAMIESKYSRLPVYRDQIDNIEGIIYVRDLLQCWSEDRAEESIAPLLRPAYFVPETKSVAELLEEMQKSHFQLAIVIDEYGGVAGLVTVEDILEEIVGEIEDEDTEGEEIIEIIEASDGYYEALGSTDIEKIERLFDIEIEDEDFTTIAGLVISEAGYVPRAGTHLTIRDIEVLDADERRINRLRLRRALEREVQAE
jgi:CBS domain containing-hemolysin-like protein